MTPAVRAAIGGAACVFFDGTFWSDDELVALGLGGARARDMAHLPVGGPGGSLAALGDHRSRHRVYIHVNNTNPILRDDSPERAAVEAAGWVVAHDGLEIEL
jgi:pyrroloquinoline quinone biosynthesis protein B